MEGWTFRKRQAFESKLKGICYEISDMMKDYGFTEKNLLAICVSPKYINAFTHEIDEEGECVRDTDGLAKYLVDFTITANHFEEDRADDTENRDGAEDSE